VLETTLRIDMNAYVVVILKEISVRGVCLFTINNHMKLDSTVKVHNTCLYTCLGGEGVF